MSDPWLVWFETEWDTKPTCEEARKDAEAQLAEYREAANFDGEWPDGAAHVAWGVTLYEAVGHEGQCTGCEARPGEDHDEECVPRDPDQPWHTDYTLEPVPGAIEAVLGLASVEQLRGELIRRDWRAGLLLAGLDRNALGWRRRQMLIIDGRDGRGWWLRESGQGPYRTEEEAARAYLAAQEVPHG